MKALVIAIILLGAGNYASYMLTGKTPSIINEAPRLPDINLPDIKKSLSQKIDAIKDKTDDNTEVQHLYKWRDDKGVIHFSSEQPVGIDNVETISYHKETNTVPAIGLIKENTDSPVNNTSPNNLSTEIPENIYSPEGIKQLINQAQDVQKLVNDQLSQQEGQLNRN